MVIKERLIVYVLIADDCETPRLPSVYSTDNWCGFMTVIFLFIESHGFIAGHIMIDISITAPIIGRYDVLIFELDIIISSQQDCKQHL